MEREGLKLLAGDAFEIKAVARDQFAVEAQFKLLDQRGRGNAGRCEFFKRDTLSSFFKAMPIVLYDERRVKSPDQRRIFFLGASDPDLEWRAGAEVLTRDSRLLTIKS